MESGSVKKTPLWDAHKRLDAKLIDFGGWHMPVSYPAGTIKEHKAVRSAVGLFDVSHMGEAYFRGPRRNASPICETSNRPSAVRTALCSLIVPAVYETGMCQPAKSTSFAPSCR